MKAEAPLERARRRGRRAGIAVFGTLVVSATAWWTSQILRQVWPSVGSVGDIECRPALRELLTALDRARGAAAAETGGEQESLRVFRSSLGAPWQARPALDVACESDARAKEMLIEIDELRYAEEHAVRYEAVRLARQRTRARAIADELGGVPESPR